MDGLEIRQLRKDSGLTQAEVARELGVDKQTVCRWERGCHRIREKEARAFITLVVDKPWVDAIKSVRPHRVRGRPFQKKQ